MKTVAIVAINEGKSPLLCDGNPLGQNARFTPSCYCVALYEYEKNEKTKKIPAWSVTRAGGGVMVMMGSHRHYQFQAGSGVPCRTHSRTDRDTDICAAWLSP